MITRILAVLSTFFVISSALNCYSCGVFLSAPTAECKGKPTETVCDPDHLGCITITGKNTDGTYYVEKRCADRKDNLDVGCENIAIQGIKATQCFCDSDYCNSSTLARYLVPLSLSISVVYALSIA